MANVKSTELVMTDNRESYPSAMTTVWNRNYVMSGSEADPQIIEMFSLPRRTMLVAMGVFHENLGSVIMSVGTPSQPSGLIQTENASQVGTAILGQGISSGITLDENNTRLIQILLDKTSGSYIAGAKIQLWAIGVKA